MYIPVTVSNDIREKIVCVCVCVCWGGVEGTGWSGCTINIHPSVLSILHYPVHCLHGEVYALVRHRFFGLPTGCFGQLASDLASLLSQFFRWNFMYGSKRYTCHHSLFSALAYEGLILGAQNSTNIYTTCSVFCFNAKALAAEVLTVEAC